jgi:hypothetical protein
MKQAKAFMTEKIHGNSIVSWSTEAVATGVNDEIVLLNMQRNRCYGLGVTGSEIWRKLAAPIRVSDLISQLKNEYEAPEGQIETDVLATLAEFQSEGLMQIHSEG